MAERRGMRVLRKGEGARLWDVHGKEYLDGMSGLYVVNAGHGRREIGDAMASQAGELAYVSAGAYTSETAVQLAEVVLGFLPKNMERLFFCSGGSEAVESAVKIAKQTQVMRGFPKRFKVIARRGGYHGSTYMALSLTTGNREQYFGPFVPGVSFIPSPNRYRPQFPGLSGEADDLACADALETEILFQGPETVAAFIAEPVSVANGTQIPSAAYWRRVREICDKHGVLLIADEVINGWGRTGSYFAVEQFGIEPDLLTMAKGLSSGYAPIGAVAVSGGVYEQFRGSEIGFGHLLTFGGQSVACAAALKNIEIFEREGLVQQSAEKGQYLLEALQGLSHHPTVGQVRGGMGLMAAVELVKDRETKENFGAEHPFSKRVHDLIHENGLMTRVWGVMNFAPPFVTSQAEIDQMVAITDAALSVAEGEFASEIRA
jgi:adenosylmethionine-8-amino-7-oxononanoate aminotransferase